MTPRGRLLSYMLRRVKHKILDADFTLPKLPNKQLIGPSVTTLPKAHSTRCPTPLLADVGVFSLFVRLQLLLPFLTGNFAFVKCEHRNDPSINLVSRKNLVTCSFHK